MGASLVAQMVKNLPAKQTWVQGLWSGRALMNTSYPLQYSCVCVCVCACSQSCPTLCDPMDCSCRASLSMEFCRQEYWSGLLFPPPGDLPDPGIEPTSLVSPVLAGGFFTTMLPGKPYKYIDRSILYS